MINEPVRTADRSITAVMLRWAEFGANDGNCAVAKPHIPLDMKSKCVIFNKKW